MRRNGNRRKISRKPNYVHVVSKSERISYEYNPEYKSYLPKAPAFRTVSSSQAKEIVERLSQPRPRTAFEKEEDLPDSKYISRHKHRPRTAFEQEENYMDSKSTHTEVSSLEIQRLSVQKLNQPTVASYIRVRMSGEKGNKLQVKDIANACDRLHLPPSQRYFPMAYKNWLYVDSPKSFRSSFDRSLHSSDLDN